MPVQPKPDGYYNGTPQLLVNGAGKLIEFMRQAFGAQERMRFPMPDGSVAHAELTIGDSVVMVADATAEFPACEGFIHLYVDDVDSVYQKALAAGATSLRPPQDEFYGDRSSTVRDISGNRWSISTHIEDVSEEEMQRRMAAMGQP
jgi:uncharacterized glyoxalase superfamily protein PhnB